jgi:hypothetical protein
MESMMWEKSSAAAGDHRTCTYDPNIFFTLLALFTLTPA